MDIVPDVTRGVNAGDLAPLPGADEIGAKPRFLQWPERIRDDELGVRESDLAATMADDRCSQALRQAIGRERDQRRFARAFVLLEYTAGQHDSLEAAFSQSIKNRAKIDGVFG